MKTLSKTYEEFCSMMLSSCVCRNPNVTFSLICRYLKVAPSDLDEYIYSQLGLTGEQVLRQISND